MDKVKKARWGSRNTIFLVLVGIYCLYAGIFIARTSFVVDGERYFTLLDDAMISMRYAKNLVEGHGLVFNPGGDKVEGFTNPLWVLYMALFHLLPIAQSKISIFIQISGAIFGLINLFLVKKLSDLMFNNSLASLSAVALAAFYLPLNNWNLQGMEVSVLAVIITAAGLMALRCIQKRESSIWLFVLLGISILIRIDMMVPSIILFGFLLKVQPRQRRDNLKYGVIILGLFLASQTLFRLWYFDDLLPNTYYLKMTGYPVHLRIARGLYVFFEFVTRMYWIPFLIPFGVLLFRRGRGIMLLTLLFSAQIAYSIYVGGDVWEWWGGSNRFISIVMPLFFILYGYAITEIGSIISRKFKPGNVSVSRIAKLSTGILLSISLVVFNSIRGPDALADWLLINPPLHVIDNINMVERARLVTEITRPQASIAVTWAGAIPYFSNRYTVDLLGKNDRRIAREEVRMVPSVAKYTDFLPGHMKRNYAYSIGVLKPDVIVQLWKSAAEAGDRLRADYEVVRFGKFIFSLRRGSPMILWNKVQKP